jgi:RimJ/RimL family protein N-acetyltransferase
MKSASALSCRSDGVVSIRPLGRRDAEVLLAGRDEEWHRWLGPGHNSPDPAACIVVGDDIVGYIDYCSDLSWLQTGEVNVGYNVLAAYRRKGYASRALQLLMRYLDECTAVHTATLLIDPCNAPSLAVANHAGFSLSGHVGRGCYFKRAVRSSTATSQASPTHILEHQAFA